MHLRLHDVDIEIYKFKTVMAVICFVPYLIGSVLSIRLFVVNVIEFTKLQCSSPQTLSVNADDIALNHRQQKILHLSAKYVSLFCVATVSTVLSFGLSLRNLNFVGLFFSIDLCLNLLCLSLQFSFAADWYQKCCCCWDSCCTAMVQSKAKRMIFIEPQRNAVHIAVSSNSVGKADDTKSDGDDLITNQLIGESESMESDDM